MVRAAPVTASGLVDLENPGLIRYPPGTAPHGSERVRLLARRAGRPTCFLECETGRLADLRLDDTPTQAAPVAVTPVAVTPVAVPPFAGPPVRSAPTPSSLTVVICTRERPEALRRCLASVATAARDRIRTSVEVVVVDNAPVTPATRETCAGWPAVRYVREPVPGLSVARNRGIAEAAGEWVAFTDDDVVVDPGWIDHLLAAASEGGDCVTGLIAPALLRTRWQHYFESKVSWGRNLARQSFGYADRRGPLYPLSVGEVGAGANFAVSAAALRRVGPFDVRLGAGSPARGGEDLDYFFRLLQAGFRIGYDPAALVWHFHRSDRAAFRRQVFGYGAGLGAYAAKRLREPAARAALASRWPVALARLVGPGGPSGGGPRGARMPARYRLLELAGMAAGFRAYARRPRR